MMNPQLFIIGVLGYLVLGRVIMRSLVGAARERAFAVINVAAIYGFLFFGQPGSFNFWFALYLAVVAVQFLMLGLFAESRKAGLWLAFFTPLTMLLLFRYLPGAFYQKAGLLVGVPLQGIPTLIGLSYLAFRCSRLVLEVRNGAIQRPTFCEYLNFAFFLPTMSVGPINTYANFRRGFAAAAYAVPMKSASLRILIGLVKYQFFGNLCDQLTYSSMLLDKHPHHWLDLSVAVIFYYLYLYCNFSGFCDMAIGSAAIVGIPVPENFDNPFAARNVKDFWNRWHITLSIYMRDVVFSPLSKIFVHAMGISRANHAIALTIIIVFLLVGIWHGAGRHFVAFGAAHALGVVTNHYYTIFLKKRLGRDGFKAYNENRWIHATAVVLTFSYVAASLFLFANTFPEMKQIFLSLR